MQKLLTLLFTALVAFSLAMPVYAQEAGAGETAKAEKKEKKGKKHGMKKKKGEKKEEMKKEETK